MTDIALCYIYFKYLDLAIWSSLPLSGMNHHIHVGQKRKKLCCPQVEFLNIWVGWSHFFFFLKLNEVQKLDAFSTSFVKTCKSS